MEEMELMFLHYLELMEQGKQAALKEELNEENPANVAEFLEELSSEKRLFVFRLLTKDQGAEVFSYLVPDTQELIAKSITDNEIRSLLDEMYLDDTVDFLSEMPANLVNKILKNTDETNRKLINQYLNYPENSAGSIMTNEFVQFRDGITVATAMEQLRRTGLDKETIYTCYVIDARRVLIGALSLRTLLLAEDSVNVSNLMEDDVICVSTMDDQEIVADLFKKYDLIALPVVDKERRLVGIITVDDIVDVIEQENTEDIEKMAALLPAEDEYLRTGVFTLAKNRVVWLFILMISGTVSSAIMNSYQDVLSAALVLSSFIPLLMGTGGNAGSQASTLIIRGMALGEIEAKDVLRVLWKELRVGIICGSILAVVNFLRILIMGGTDILVNIVVSVTIFAVIIVAKAVGCMLPIGAKKLHLDPAIMASPLITTIVDCVTLIIFFRISQLLIL